RRADELRDALLSPEVCAQLAKFRRLTICGAGMLHNLPFELLPIEVDGEERYLGEVTAIDYVANLVRAYEARPRRDPERVLLTASLRTTRGGLTPYDVRRPQLQEMRERYPDGVTMFDDEVQVGRLVEQLEQADVVHLIGHGFAEPGRIYQNGIVFSDAEGDALWGDRIVGRRLDGVVVILGSCGIGNAPYRRGGEPLAASLPGAMLAAGARCVIVPMSDLAYGNHEAAMQTLHAELVRGTTPADAMLIARRALAEAGRGDAWLELMMMQVHGRGF
ncbi:MAG: CHAT domain-containing protein, partial [Planctomycetes bacterium]|nr:CHAT domain-containing protein [Planctomycetota bacterium]